ncbi:MAG: cell wall-active antibiotics response protein, partial [Gemmatimonadetes bacterium]|nr:cell wall-active antibiotics response protein [Gemmatimonadota bacterium]
TPLRAALPIAVVAAFASTASATAGQDWRTETVSRQFVGQERLAVDLRHAVGTLRVRPANTRTLFSMNLAYDADVFRAVTDFDGDRVTLGLEGRDRDLRIKKGGRTPEMDVRLSPTVALNLSLDFGAGRADVDLGGLRLSGLDIETAASETRLDVSQPNREILRSASVAVGAAQFTAERIGNLNAERLSVDAGVGHVVLSLEGSWQRDLDIEVEMGVGAIEIRVPRDLGLKLVKESFLTALDAPEMERDGDAWYSPDWTSAERRITIDVEAAFGAIEVVWLR